MGRDIKTAMGRDIKTDMVDIREERPFGEDTMVIAGIMAQKIMINRLCLQKFLQV